MIRPLNRWILVSLDPLEKLDGIILPNGVDHVDIRTATVLAIGDKKKILPGLEVGDKVAFHRWHTQHKQGEAIVHTLAEYSDDEDLALIQDIDVLFAFDSSETPSFK